MQLERRTVHYDGHVQGVGFRYTAQASARGHPVTGFVRNLPNGQVELIVEGSRDALDRFLGKLAQRMAGYITHTSVDQAPATGEFDSFGIRH